MHLQIDHSISPGWASQRKPLRPCLAEVVVALSAIHHLRNSARFRISASPGLSVQGFNRHRCQLTIGSLDWWEELQDTTIFLMVKQKETMFSCEDFPEQPTRWLKDVIKHGWRVTTDHLPLNSMLSFSGYNKRHLFRIVFFLGEFPMFEKTPEGVTIMVDCLSVFTSFWEVRRGIRKSQNSGVSLKYTKRRLSMSIMDILKHQINHHSDSKPDLCCKTIKKQLNRYRNHLLLQNHQQ